MEEPVWLDVAVLDPVPVKDDVGAADLDCVWDGDRVGEGLVVGLEDPEIDGVDVALVDCEAVLIWDRLCDTEVLCDCVPIVAV